MKRATRGAYGKATVKPDSLGKRIRKIRLAWQWTQHQLAETIHANQKTLSRWELDRQEPGEPALGALAALFGLGIESLRTGKGFKIPQPPRKVGNIMVAESFATDLLQLPPPTMDGLILIDRREDRAIAIASRKVAGIIRQAQEDGRTVYLVLG